VDELKDHLQNYSSKMSELLTESHLTWADFESALADGDENEDDDATTVKSGSIES
jgi:hypothetical protein